jgi:type VI secretion system protein ImpJ
MYLGPHHFQVQNRYFEDSIRFATSSLWYAPFGVVACELDPEALHNGTLSLLHARGVFRDGLVFHMPECDPLVEARHIAEAFPPVRDSVVAYLSVPPRRPEGLNCVLPEEVEGGSGPRARFTAETEVLHDETTGKDEKPVRLGRKNIELKLDFELDEDAVNMAIARVRRDGKGHFVLDPEFIPPCLELGASERLMFILRRLIEILENKSDSIQHSRQGGQRWTEYSVRDIANFWFLHTVHSALAPLRHLYLSKRGHPEELFVEMLRLGGALCTFALDAHPRTMPLYDHLNLDDCFDKLDRHIRLLLETIIRTNCISIPLTKVRDYFYHGPITDQRTMGQARWVLAIRAGLGQVELITKTPQLVKVCSQKFLEKLVERALPGLGLTHLSVPPPAIAVRPDTQYFGVSRFGPCWDSIRDTREVALYVPGELPNPELELFAILE